MAPGELDQAFKTVLKATTQLLRPLGFKRRGSTLRLVRNDVSGLINFQRSSWSSREEIRFTINVGVVYGTLLARRVALDRALECDAHVWGRLCSLSHRGQDHWWTIIPSTDIAGLSAEVASEVSRYALPVIEKYLEPRMLLESLDSGLAPGLTRRVRIDHLARLKAACGGVAKVPTGESHPENDEALE